MLRFATPDGDDLIEIRERVSERDALEAHTLLMLLLRPASAGAKSRRSSQAERDSHTTHDTRRGAAGPHRFLPYDKATHRLWRCRA